MASTDAGMGEVLRHLSAVEDRLERIERALTGDSDMGVPGLVRRLDIVEVKLQSYEKRVARILWMCVGAGASAGGAAQLVFELLSGIG